MYIKRDDMIKVDAHAINRLKLENIMPLAGQRLAEFIVAAYEDEPLVFLIGRGNNGGGGIHARLATDLTLANTIVAGNTGINTASNEIAGWSEFTEDRRRQVLALTEERRRARREERRAQRRART